MSTYTYRRPFSLCMFEDCGSELLIKLLHFIGRQYFVRFAEAVAFVWRNTFVAVGSQWCVVGNLPLDKLWTLPPYCRHRSMMLIT